MSLNRVNRYTKNVIISSNKHQKEYEYWMESLKECKEASILPTDNDARKNIKTDSEVEYVFGEEVSSKAVKLCNNSPLGLLVFFCTGVSYLLSRYTGEETVLMGMPILKENASNTLMNDMLAYCQKVDNNYTFKQYLVNGKQIVNKAFVNQMFPLYYVFKKLNIPLYKEEAMFPVIVEMEELHETGYEEMSGASCIFRFKLENGTISMKTIFDSSRYAEQTIRQIGRDMNSYMSQVLSNYDLKIGEIDVLTKEFFSQWKEKRDRMRRQETTLAKEEEVHGYEAPVTEKEIEIARAWEEVLGKSNIGRHDNFFELGGDSIKAIRLLAILLKYKFTVKDIYTYPTIAQLESVMKESNDVISQETFTGAVSLSPIQKHFFESKGFHYSHYNQSLFLYRKDRFDISIVKEVLNGIIHHHDMLRARYRLEDGTVEQIILPPENMDSFYQLNEYDFLEQDEELARKQIMEQVNALQAHLDIVNGPLIRLGCFHTKEGDHLLITMHHLLTDGFSWRIILEDFTYGYLKRSKGEELSFASKTHSYKAWVDTLQEYATDIELNEERSYWKDVCKKAKLEKTEQYSASIKNRKDFAIVLSEEETQQVRLKASEQFVSMEHIMLGCVVMALRKLLHKERLVVEMEGHGRGDVSENLNITRTVGWFTSVYPVLIDITEDNINSYIEKIAETLSAVPSGGLSYGVLKYLSKDGLGESLDIAADIRFNYLGEFDQNLNSEFMSISNFDFGYTVDPDYPVDFLFDINSIIIENKLRINLNYIESLTKIENLKLFDEIFRNSIREFIAEQNKRTDLEVQYESYQYIEGIKPFNDLIYKDCFYNALFPVFQYYQKDIRSILANDMFVYTTQDDSQNIDAEYILSEKMLNVLSKSGLKINRIVHSNDIITNIKGAISEKKLVIIRVDCYFISTREDTYNKEHWPHTLLVYGYDDKNEAVYVLDQSDKNTLDFSERKINYCEIIDAYVGIKENFIIDKEYPSYMDIQLASKKVKESSKTEYVEIIKRNLLKHQNEKMQGFDILSKFIENFDKVIQDEETFKKASSGYLYSFGNILKIQTAALFRLTRIFPEDFIDRKTLEELVRGWRYAKNIIEKYSLTGRYRKDSLSTTTVKLKELCEVEKSFTQNLIASLS